MLRVGEEKITVEIRLLAQGIQQDLGLFFGLDHCPSSRDGQ